MILRIYPEHTICKHMIISCEVFKKSINYLMPTLSINLMILRIQLSKSQVILRTRALGLPLRSLWLGCCCILASLIPTYQHQYTYGVADVYHCLQLSVVQCWFAWLSTKGRIIGKIQVDETNKQSCAYAEIISILTLYLCCIRQKRGCKLTDGEKVKTSS